jgi:hypothetical protein
MSLEQSDDNEARTRWDREIKIATEALLRFDAPEVLLWRLLQELATWAVAQIRQTDDPAVVGQLITDEWQSPDDVADLHRTDAQMYAEKLAAYRAVIEDAHLIDSGDSNRGIEQRIAELVAALADQYDARY